MTREKWKEITENVCDQMLAYTRKFVTAIDRNQLGVRVLDGGGLDYEIGRALDRVFSGV